MKVVSCYVLPLPLELTLLTATVLGSFVAHIITLKLAVHPFNSPYVFLKLSTVASCSQLCLCDKYNTFTWTLFAQCYRWTLTWL